MWATTHNEEKNILIMVIGYPGTGKSFISETLALANYPKFTAEDTAFTKDRFLELVNTRPKHAAYVADETGKWFGARKWNTDINKMLTECLEIMRMKQHIVYFTLPFAKQGDITLRRMANIIIKTMRIHRHNKKTPDTRYTNHAECKFLYNEGDSWEGDTYQKFPHVPKEDGQIVTVSRLFVARPPAAMEKAYKKLKKKWTEGALEDMQNGGGPEEKVTENMVECYHCGNEWNYTGKAKVPTCPSCHKIIIKNV